MWAVRGERGESVLTSRAGAAASAAFRRPSGTTESDNDDAHLSKVYPTVCNRIDGGGGTPCSRAETRGADSVASTLLSEPLPERRRSSFVSLFSPSEREEDEEGE